MSAICLLLVRNIKDKQQLFSALKQYCFETGVKVTEDSGEYSVDFPFIKVNPNTDVVCFPGEIQDWGDSSYFASFDGYAINGKIASFPLHKRLKILQDIIGICLQMADCVELFLTSDPPLKEGYKTIYLPVQEVANTLDAEYSLVPAYSHFVPEIHCVVQNS